MVVAFVVVAVVAVLAVVAVDFLLLLWTISSVPGVRFVLTYIFIPRLILLTQTSTFVPYNFLFSSSSSSARAIE